MKAMLKFPLGMGMNEVVIPGGLLKGCTVGHQPGELGTLQLWTLADTDKPLNTSHIYLAVTGEELPKDVEFLNLGTVLLNGGGFVVHALLIK